MKKQLKLQKLAYDESCNLKQAAIKLGYLDEEKFDSLIKTGKMI